MLEKNSFWKELGRNIANLRNTRSITQENLSKALNLSRTTITNIEKGRQSITVFTFVQICQVLNCRIDEIIPKASSSITKDAKDKISSYDSKVQRWLKDVIKG